MHSGWSLMNTLAAGDLGWLGGTLGLIKVLIGFSIIIFVHELGHFLAAKWAGIRVDRFAVGFGYRLFGWRRGEGFTFGKRPNYTTDEQRERDFGETDYCLNALPFGGYVKMLGQDDVILNEETGEYRMTDDPRAFTNKPVGKRMVVASAGVVFNALFAILAYACVYMVGKPEIAPRLGPMEGSSPAAAAGLRPNDLILTANGEKVSSFRDIATAVILSDNGSVVFQVERDGRELPDALILQTVRGAESPLVEAGISPATTTELASDVRLEDVPELRAGDRITEVAGKPVSSATEFLYAFSAYVTATGASGAEITLKRPDPEDPTRSTSFKATLPAGFVTEMPSTSAKSERRSEAQNVLGLSPRCKAGTVLPGQPADKAGVRADDVIVQWGTIPNPVFAEIVETIQANVDRPIPIVVERDGKQIDLVVTPQRPFHLLGTPKAQVGIAFVNEDTRPIVAQVADGSPASALKMPRGSQILEVAGTPTNTWFDVLHALRAAAGQTITVRYRTGNVEAEGRMTVPSSVVDALNLPPLVLVTSIAGESRLTQGDEVLRLPAVSAIRGLLEKHKGETVTVEYQTAPDDPQIHRGEFTVAADGSNTDPWQMRVLLLPKPSNIPFKHAQTVVRVNNPLTALGLGTRQTGAVLVEMYRLVTAIVKNLAQGDTSTVQHVSGPVGIVGFAVERAKLGYVELLSFLAFLSVNLAVINFIPFPVVDGGLMVFLIIEKIKGKPLSLKTQMVATLVGLATIILVFVLVTFKDITNMLS